MRAAAHDGGSTITSMATPFRQLRQGLIIHDCDEHALRQLNQPFGAKLRECQVDGLDDEAEEIGDIVARNRQRERVGARQYGAGADQAAVRAVERSGRSSDGRAVAGCAGCIALLIADNLRCTNQIPSARLASASALSGDPPASIRAHVISPAPRSI